MKRLAMMIVLLAASAQAAVIVQTDGKRIEGKISRTGDGWTVTEDDGKSIYIDADKVASIEPGNSHGDGSEAIDRLDSLRRTVDHMSDIQQIIGKYEVYLSQNTDPTALQEANKDLSQWHDRADRGLVKLGDKWITPQERENRRQVAQSEATSAVQLLRQGREDDAQSTLKQAAIDDPQNKTALYLLGVIYYNQNQLDKSQAAFESANTASPGDAATLNNLAVIASRHRSFLRGIDYYVQAMSASPENQPVLDNVAEALNEVPIVNQHAPVLLKAAALFQAQDPILQQSQARLGYFRWGSSWVTSRQLDELKAQQAAVQKQLDSLRQSSDSLQDQITKIDTEIDANTREIHRLQGANTYTDSMGNTLTVQVSPAYYDLVNDNTKLESIKKDIQNKQSDVQQQAKMIQQQLPHPPFTGVQHIIGIDVVTAPDSSDAQVPAALPTPATMPSTQPG